MWCIHKGELADDDDAKNFSIRLLLNADRIFSVVGLSVHLVCKPKTTTTIECGPMPNVMAALPNIGGALCSTQQSLADTHY